MKKTAIVLLTVMLFAFILSSCKNDKIERNTPEDSEKYFSSSTIAKTESDGRFTFNFDPYVLPEDAKKTLVNLNYYNSFVKAVMNHDDCVDLPDRAMYDYIRFAMNEGFPFVCLIENYKFDVLENKMYINYKFDESECEEHIEKFKNMVKEIFDECTQNSDSDTIAAISVYSYIAKNFKLIKSSASTNDDTSSAIAETEKDDDSLNEYSLYDTVKNKEGTDENIAKLYSFLLMQLSIENKCVCSWNGNLYKTWNLIKLKNKWYHCDIANEINSKDGCGLSNFGMTEKTVIKKLGTKKIFSGVNAWFTDDIPSAKSNRFEDFADVISFEFNDERNRIEAVSSSFSKFTWKE